MEFTAVCEPPESSSLPASVHRGSGCCGANTTSANRGAGKVNAGVRLSVDTVEVEGKCHRSPCCSIAGQPQLEDREKTCCGASEDREDKVKNSTTCHGTSNRSQCVPVKGRGDEKDNLVDDGAISRSPYCSNAGQPQREGGGKNCCDASEDREDEVKNSTTCHGISNRSQCLPVKGRGDEKDSMVDDGAFTALKCTLINVDEICPCCISAAMYNTEKHCKLAVVHTACDGA